MKTKIEATHTPGESWRIGDAGHTVFGPKTDTLSPKVVASNLSRAEARLIVAAHDLFEAAKAMFADEDKTMSALAHSQRQAKAEVGLRAAIRKAGEL